MIHLSGAIILSVATVAFIAIILGVAVELVLKKQGTDALLMLAWTAVSAALTAAWLELL